MKINQILGLVLLVAFTLGSCKQDVKIESTSSHKTEKLNWLSMNDIEAAVKADPKPVLIDVYTKWCGPCKMLDKSTFSDPEVQKMFAEHFHIVKFDAEGKDEVVYQGKTYANPKFQEGKRGRNSQHELTRTFKVRGYPTMAIYDANLSKIAAIVGYKKPEQLLAELKKYAK